MIGQMLKGKLGEGESLEVGQYYSFFHLMFKFLLLIKATSLLSNPESCLDDLIFSFPFLMLVFFLLLNGELVFPIIKGFIPGLQLLPLVWLTESCHAASYIQQEVQVECDHFRAAVLAVNGLFRLSPFCLSCGSVVLLITCPGPRHILIAAGWQESNTFFLFEILFGVHMMDLNWRQTSK